MLTQILVLRLRDGGMLALEFGIMMFYRQAIRFLFKILTMQVPSQLQ